MVSWYVSRSSGDEAGKIFYRLAVTIRVVNHQVAMDTRASRHELHNVVLRRPARRVVGAVVVIVL